MKIKQLPQSFVRPLAAAAFSIGLLAALAFSVNVANSADAATSSSSDGATTSTAIFAGGCFWCVESDFDAVPGVIETVSGYSGGNTENPTYKNHHAGKHREVVQITYDSTKVSYEQLLHVFWRSVDPTDEGGQFCDRGHSYTTAIYTVDQAQQEAAIASKAMLVESGVLSKSVVTPVETASMFWAAEGYHQDYYKKNPIRYKYYRTSCGRDKRVAKVWGEEAHSGIERH